jgi:protein TonB
MFDTLIQSGAVPTRHPGGSIASVIIHAVVITSAVALTARESTRPMRPDDLVKTVVFDIAPRRHVVQPTEARPAGPAVAAAPRALTLETPTIIPVGIPPIDLGRAPTPVDFGARRLTGATILCDHDCGSPPSLTADGAATWNAADVMMRLEGDPVPPRYPEALRRAGIEGSVVVKFRVDTLGRVDMASVEVLRSTHGAFADAVRESLGRLRFTPSLSGDRKVPALAIMPFHFTLR